MDLIEASHYEKLDEDRVRCLLCPFRCRIDSGKRGRCNVRENRLGDLYALSYGRVTGTHLDPVEKKPLHHFFPGRRVFSIGSWGCNLKCAFCQNCSISQFEVPTRPLSPEEAASAALADGSVGVAYTYNEPLIAFEYVLASAKLVRRAGGKNILVTNGFINPEPLDELLPFVDAMNIDVKAFNDGFYRNLCKGALAPVLETVKTAAARTHVELTTLVIPGENDAVPELEDLAAWIGAHCGRLTPVHLTAYFPSYQMQKAATTEMHLLHARDIFRRQLDYVYVGNVRSAEGSDTLCRNCGAAVVKRHAFACDLSGMTPEGLCARCGAGNNIVTK